VTDGSLCSSAVHCGKNTSTAYVCSWAVMLCWRFLVHGSPYGMTGAPFTPLSRVSAEAFLMSWPIAHPRGPVSVALLTLIGRMCATFLSNKLIGSACDPRGRACRPNGKGVR